MNECQCQANLFTSVILLTFQLTQFYVTKLERLKEIMLILSLCKTAFLRPYIRQNMTNTMQCSISSMNSQKFRSTRYYLSSMFMSPGLAVTLQLLHGDIEQLRREYMTIFSRGVSITRKLGFSDVIMPGEETWHLSVLSQDINDRQSISNASCNYILLYSVLFQKLVMAELKLSPTDTTHRHVLEV